MHHTGYTRVNSLEIQSKSIGTQENRYSIVIHKLDIYSVVGGITVFYLQNDRVLVKGNTTDTKEGKKRYKSLPHKKSTQRRMETDKNQIYLVNVVHFDETSTNCDRFFPAVM